MKASQLAALVAVCLSCFAGSVAAQQQATPVTVLAFSARGDGVDLAADLYNALRTQVEFHRDYRLNDVPPQSLDDLLLAVGCTELDRVCSRTVADVVGTRLLAWGEVSVSDATITVRMTLWDLETAAEVRARTHIVGRDFQEVLVRNDQMIGRSLLYEAVGRLTVDPVAPGARVDVAGYGSGPAPFVAEGLALGLYTVTVEAEGFQPSREVVVVDIGGAVHSPSMRQAVATREPRTGPSLDPAVAQWSLVGLGAASAAAGIVFGVQKVQTQSDFDDVTSSRSLDRDRAERLRDEGERQARLSNTFVGVGAGLIVAGVIWKVAAPGRDDEGDVDEPWARVGAFASRRSGGVSIDLRF